MASYLIVFLGAGIGGALRHLMNAVTMHLALPGFVGTCVINVTGSFLIGAVIEYLALKGHLPSRWQLFLTTGILGGYTTFSTFSLETTLLVERGQYATAAGYVAVSVVLSIGATFAALALLRLAFQGAAS